MFPLIFLLLKLIPLHLVVAVCAFAVKIRAVWSLTISNNFKLPTGFTTHSRAINFYEVVWMLDLKMVFVVHFMYRPIVLGLIKK